MKNRVFLGVDVGSVSTDLVAMGPGGEVIETLYLRTQGQPIRAVQEGLALLQERLRVGVEVTGVGTTGSGRYLSAVIVGADVVKNEITTHAVAASTAIPGVNTVLEIGGQDSKIIVLRNGVVADFAMNTVCAAGTGSFLDQQAGRLNLPIEEFGGLALKARTPVRIAGRCAVFAESDMIHKQQMGHSLPDIVAGLCEALVRNYMNNVGKGKEVVPPVSFQGGVAANIGMQAAFERALGLSIIVPEHYSVMGAIGAAILAREAVSARKKSKFRGFKVAEENFKTTSFECKACPDRCEVVQVRSGRDTLARWGDRCGKYTDALARRQLNEAEKATKVAAAQ